MNMVSFLDFISQFCIMLFVFTSLSPSLFLPFFWTTTTLHMKSSRKQRHNNRKQFREKRNIDFVAQKWAYNGFNFHKSSDLKNTYRTKRIILHTCDIKCSKRNRARLRCVVSKKITSKKNGRVEIEAKIFVSTHSRNWMELLRLFHLIRLLFGYWDHAYKIRCDMCVLKCNRK